MNKSHCVVHPNGRHLVVVADDAPDPIGDRPVAPLLATTTRCRPSELPTTVQLQLTESALRCSLAGARTAALDVETWIRLAVDAARQASRAADLIDMPIDELHAAIDTTAEVALPTTPMIAAATTAYVRALRDRSSPIRCGARRDDGLLIVHVSDELATAWTMDAIAAGMSLDAWASLQVLTAPRDAVAWEVAAARRGCYLGEWVLAAALAANRSSARPHA
jgi:hypothetical protein